MTKYPGEPTTSEAAEEVARLIGARLESVAFVVNYLQLDFSGCLSLTLLVWPEVHLAGETLATGTPGYNDALCALIQSVVTGVTTDGCETICITFDSGAELNVLLRPVPLCGERLMLNGPEHYLFVW
ncbi:MAG: hypothetical protein KGJ62_05400 [Armatimonadetes bacterium]|nr:hypothetical protein [Armatimonadota bacterium]MDE2206642.1 hypothetical protein [Armatimonadota bacterium]